MATTFTNLWRLAILAPLDPGTSGSWGSIQDATMSLMEQGTVGFVNVSLSGPAQTLTTANNATDQARYFIQNYTGALTGNCTVAIPNIPKVGWAQNNTTGGFNVILSAGAGTTVAIPPNGLLYWWLSDGAGNVSFLQMGLGSQESQSYMVSAAISQTILLPAGFRRFRLTLQNFSVSNTGSLIYAQFSSNGGSSFVTSNYVWNALSLVSPNGAFATNGNEFDAGLPLSPSLLAPSGPGLFDGNYEINPGGAAANATIRGNGFGVSVGDLYGGFQMWGSYYGTSALMNAMQIYIGAGGSGTLSGTIILEGLP